MSTLLTELVRKQSAYALLGIFNRVIDKVAEEIAHDLLRDAETRAELEKLVRLAVQQTLKELNEPAPPADMPEHRHRQLDRIEEFVLGIRKKESKDSAPPTDERKQP